VTALVELKARFDEAANIRQSRRLERAGAHVVYGFLNYKTHAKISTVVRREGDSAGHLHPFRDRQLPPDHGAHLHRPVAVHLRPGAGARCDRVFNYLSGYAQPDGLENLRSRP
jgi:polyphosphate kinase